MVSNTNTLLGQDGIIGLKTGSDTAAGGCVLLAARRQARGHDTLIVAATFGQPGTMATILPNALQAGHQLVLALGRALAGQSAQHSSARKPGKQPRIGRHRLPGLLPPSAPPDMPMTAGQRFFVTRP
jgi:D-alanyl-D-alanine carboxypeptidase